MPGSAAAIKEPWRMAVSYLEDAYGDAWPDLDLPVLGAVDEGKRRIIREMIARRINSPLTSSLGRLFDGVAALAGLRSRVSYEGQAAMELEMAAADDPSEVYAFGFEGQTPIRILPAPLIRGVVLDLGRRVPLPVISARFHNTVVRLLAEVCTRIGRERALKQVVLSGGVFQNARLLSALIPALISRGFEVYSHRQVPTNDGGICLGQAVAAAARLKKA
jgi:hydrogenase maturation protein HypF